MRPRAAPARLSFLRQPFLSLAFAPAGVAPNRRGALPRRLPYKLPARSPCNFRPAAQPETPPEGNPPYRNNFAYGAGHLDLAPGDDPVRARAGFGTDLGDQFSPEFRLAAGRHLRSQRRTAPSPRCGGVPGVYFLGLPWQSCRASSFIWAVWHANISHRRPYRHRPPLPGLSFRRGWALTTAPPALLIPFWRPAWQTLPVPRPAVAGHPFRRSSHAFRPAPHRLSRRSRW